MSALGDCMPGFEFFASEHVASYLTLTFLEIVLAGDNLVLIAILAGRLPEHQRALARRLGLFVAVATRLLLLFSLFWLSHLETPLAFEVGGMPLAVTPRQLVFGFGGLFLIWRAIVEIANMLGSGGRHAGSGMKAVHAGFMITILQIAIFDVIFSLDSVIAAIGIAQHVEVMVAAILTATAVMFFLVNPISNFIERFPIVKLIALNFLVLIGALLVADAVGVDVPHLAFYGALALSVVVQISYLWVRDMRPGARLALMLLTLAAAGIIAASQMMDLSPLIGQQAAATLRDTVGEVMVWLQKTIDWLQTNLAKL